MTTPHALIIEDDAALAEIFTLVLQEAGYDTDVVEDGALAMERLLAVVPDLVTLDLNLPHISGKEILRNIRADERLADVKVMLVTANAVLADALREDSDLVLVKPVSTAQLRDLARRLRPDAAMTP